MLVDLYDPSTDLCITIVALHLLVIIFCYVLLLKDADASAFRGSV
jgi:hypothetical protein